MSIKAVIFDFGGVIVPGSPQAQTLEDSFYGRLERQFGLPPGCLWDAVYIKNPAWLRLRVGEGTHDDWYEATRAAIRELGYGEAADRVIAELQKPRPVEFNDGIIELIESLRGAFRVGLLSNAAPGLEAQLAEHYGIAHLFDDIINSATVRLAKPDARIYRLAAERLDLEPPNCFFTDDLGHNIEAAREVGMVAHQFDGVAGLRAALRAAGVALPERGDGHGPGA